MGILDGKAAIVTGSARGIGRATAELLVAQGARVLINDLDGDLAEEVSAAIDGETAVFAGDLTEPDAPEKLIAAGHDAFGEIDAVVNNAGYSWDGVIHKMEDDQFQAMLDIHTVVPFRVIRALAPYWREAAKKERDEGVERFRKIVNISSTTGVFGNAGQSNYAAGKAAVVGLTKTIAKEWGQFKINSNAVAFGFVETRLTEEKESAETFTAPDGTEVQLGIPAQRRSLAPMMIPIGRAGQPFEAAGPVVFLCSNLADFVNGQVIMVTGGGFGGMQS
ncbi:MAG: SDR family NAD(P)-dependent oxidoreductase [Solirubrobacterales bacterium]